MQHAAVSGQRWSTRFADTHLLKACTTITWISSHTLEGPPPPPTPPSRNICLLIYTLKKRRMVQICLPQTPPIITHKRNRPITIHSCHIITKTFMCMDQNQLTPTPAAPPHELKIITKGYESQELAETDLGECGTIFLPRCSHNASTQLARDLPPPKNNNSTYPSIQESCQGVIRHSPHHLRQNFANALEESTGICKQEPEKDADNMTMLVAPVAFHFFRETCALMSTVFLIVCGVCDV